MDSPHDKIASRIDQMNYLKRKPMEYSPELKRVEDNLRFSKKMNDDPLQKHTHERVIFGRTFDPAVQVYGNNIWDRSIFDVDALCDLYVSASIDQQQKYLKKKRKTDSNMLWLLILVGFGGVALLILFIVMGVVGG